MCVLAAQQDNETNMANDDNMSEKTNSGRAREEATEVKPRQVELDHLKSLAGAADKVKFVQHISAHLSHMCSLLPAFSTAFGQIFTHSHMTLRGKDVLDFYSRVQFIFESHRPSFLCIQANSPSPPHPGWQGISLRKERKEKTLFCLLPRRLSFSFTHGLSFCCAHTQTHTELCPVVSVSHMPSS